LDLISTCLVLGPLCGAVSPAEGVSSLNLNTVASTLHPSHKHAGEGAPQFLLRIAKLTHDVLGCGSKVVGPRPENETEAARRSLHAVVGCLRRLTRDGTWLTLHFVPFVAGFQGTWGKFRTARVFAAAAALESWTIVDDALEKEKSALVQRRICESKLNGQHLMWWIVRSRDTYRLRKSLEFARSIDGNVLHEFDNPTKWRSHFLT
jgi:hypothetical protein